MQIPRVAKNDVLGFARKWTYNGVALLLNDAHIKFAEDFANQTLMCFVQMVAQQQMAAAQAAAKKIVSTEDV
jgi:hypothetical protein